MRVSDTFNLIRHCVGADYHFPFCNFHLVVMGLIDSISYLSTIVGTMRLNLTPFPLSVRNSPIAVAHLIKKAQLIQVFVSPDPAMQRLIAEAREILRNDGGVEIEVLDMIQLSDIEDGGEGAEVENGHATAEIDEMMFPKVELDSTAIILHSSGELK